jgi:hypothetical protein
MCSPPARQLLTCARKHAQTRQRPGERAACCNTMLSHMRAPDLASWRARTCCGKPGAAAAHCMQLWCCASTDTPRAHCCWRHCADCGRCSRATGCARARVCSPRPAARQPPAALGWCVQAPRVHGLCAGPVMHSRTHCARHTGIPCARPRARRCSPSKPSSRRLICTAFGAPPAIGRGPVATLQLTLRCCCCTGARGRPLVTWPTTCLCAAPPCAAARRPSPVDRFMVTTLSAMGLLR